MPVSVDMEVTIAEGSSPHLTFDGGLIMVEQIAFSGHRNQGGDVYFATEDGDGFGPVSFPHNSFGHIKKFDIPQGVYSHMEWDLALDDIDSQDDDDVEDADDEWQVADGGLWIAGTYTRVDGAPLPLYVSVDDDEQFSVKTEGVEGAANITLHISNSYLAQFVIDPYYATQTVSVRSLENAEVSSGTLGDYIEISADKNEALYENILFRLERSAKVVIK